MNSWHGFFRKYRKNKELEDVTKLNLWDTWHPKQPMTMNYLFLIAAMPGQPS